MSVWSKGGYTSKGQGLQPNRMVGEIVPSDIDEVYAYDGPRSKLDRRADLTYFARWAKVFVYRRHSQLCGFLACLRGLASVQFGPLAAEGEEEAEVLFRHALAVFKNRNCRTRVMAEDSVLVAALRNLSFEVYRIDLLMVRGIWHPATALRLLGPSPRGLEHRKK